MTFSEQFTIDSFLRNGRRYVQGADFFDAVFHNLTQPYGTNPIFDFLSVQFYSPIKSGVLIKKTISPQDSVVGGLTLKSSGQNVIYHITFEPSPITDKMTSNEDLLNSNFMYSSELKGQSKKSDVYSNVFSAVALQKHLLLSHSGIEAKGKWHLYKLSIKNPNEFYTAEGFEISTKIFDSKFSNSKIMVKEEEIGNIICIFKGGPTYANHDFE